MKQERSRRFQALEQEVARLKAPRLPFQMFRSELRCRSNAPGNGFT